MYSHLANPQTKWSCKDSSCSAQSLGIYELSVSSNLQHNLLYSHPQPDLCSESNSIPLSQLALARMIFQDSQQFFEGLFLWRLWHCQSCVSKPQCYSTIWLHFFDAIVQLNFQAVIHTFNPLLENPYSCHSEPSLLSLFWGLHGFKWTKEDSSRFSQVIRLVTEQLDMHLTSLVTIYTTS